MSNHWIQTFTGIKFDLLEPTEEMFCIEDVAHHLSIINRFVGASKFHYSVGYHCVLSCQMAPKHLKLEALLHEIDEPYINDLSYPLKMLLLETTDVIKNISSNIKKIGWKKFGVLDTDNDYAHTIEAKKLKEIDCRMAITEEMQLMRNKGWLYGEKYEGLEPYFGIEILKLDPSNIEQLFLAEYRKWRRDN